jgi:AmmeMemoRadiSam system protein A
MDELEPIERKELLRIARSTLREYLALGMIPPGAPHRESLKQPAGSFVTLKTLPEGHLRGCIGTFSADTPLHKCVQQMAVSAATRDPRFSAVEPDELAHLSIEISVLSPRQRIDDPQAIEVGKHGVCITHGPHHGVLLPQVPVEHGWDRETFLEHLCLKAGLPTDAWHHEKTVLEVFTAEVFGEEDPELKDL